MEDLAASCDLMGMSTIYGNLEREIERLVRAHVIAQQLAVSEAVKRRFAVSGVSRLRARRPAFSGHTRKRREPGEMDGDVNRLYETVREPPGETIIFLAFNLEQTRAALVRPMMILKRGGRVRSAGWRNLMRYFPMNAVRPRSPRSQAAANRDGASSWSRLATQHAVKNAKTFFFCLRAVCT